MERKRDTWPGAAGMAEGNGGRGEGGRDVSGVGPDGMTRTGVSRSPERWAAYGVHVFTAVGIVFALLAAAEISTITPDPRLVFLYLGLQVLVDAVDGPLARKYHVKRYTPHIDGRKMDDIIDYITYTFLPLLLVWKMEWLPAPAMVWLIPAAITSLFGFSNLGAKDEDDGFFLGFPSYWNIVALYLGLWYELMGPWPGAALVVVLSVLTVMPVRFIYPNLAPHPWKLPMLIGGGVWGLLVAWMIFYYDVVPGWIMGVSLIYPVAYVVLSLYLDPRGIWRRRTRETAA